MERNCDKSRGVGIFYTLVFLHRPDDELTRVERKRAGLEPVLKDDAGNLLETEEGALFFSSLFLFLFLSLSLSLCDCFVVVCLLQSLFFVMCTSSSPQHFPLVV
jgi:hypothetical protein